MTTIASLATKLTAASLLLGASMASIGQTSNYRNFDYSGHVNRLGHVGWQVPIGFYDDKAPGLYLAFFGNADPAAGCPTEPSSAALPVFNNIYWANLLSDTGISSGGPGTEFSPYSNHPSCVQKNRLGFTHAHFKNFTDGNSVRGLGLYSYTGPTPVDSSLAFFQTDQINIQGNFAMFRNCNGSDCSGANVPRPFSGSSADFNLLRVAIVSYQGLARFSMESPQRQQVRQQIVINIEGLTQPANRRKPAIQYLLATAIAGKDATAAPEVRNDPAQANIPFIGGSLLSAGRSTTARDGAGNSYALWTSWGEPTKTAVWSGQKRFQAEISFTQFQNLLKLVAAKNFGRSNASQVTHAELVDLFGDNYKQPLNWVVSMQTLAHEVFNEDWRTKRAIVGGNATELKIISLPY